MPIGLLSAGSRPPGSAFSRAEPCGETPLRSDQGFLAGRKLLGAPVPTGRDDWPSPAPGTPSGSGQALGGGLGDRRQAWEFIRRFAAEWTAPLASGDGVGRDSWLAAEQRIGAELSTALREAYLLFGRRPDLTARQDRLVPPHELSVDEWGTTVVFRVENQRCAICGVALADLGSADPPVYLQRRDGGWEPFLGRVSVACAEMVPIWRTGTPARLAATRMQRSSAARPSRGVVAL